MKDDLLCDACENLFNENGESWVLNQCYRGKDRFKLWRSLDRARPLVINPNVALYASAGIAEINIEKLAYFATSVIWRAAVHKWNLDSHTTKRIEIRLDHLEQLRMYLFGHAAFPTDASLWVSVAHSAEPSPVVIAPYGGYDTSFKGMPFYSYRFIVPGIMFTLFFGRFVPPIVYRLCSVRSADRLIHRTANLERLVWMSAAEFFKTCQPSADLLARSSNL